MTFAVARTHPHAIQYIFIMFLHHATPWCSLHHDTLLGFFIMLRCVIFSTSGYAAWCTVHCTSCYAACKCQPRSCIRSTYWYNGMCKGYADTSHGHSATAEACQWRCFNIYNRYEWISLKENLQETRNRILWNLVKKNWKRIKRHRWHFQLHCDIVTQCNQHWIQHRFGLEIHQDLQI